MALLLVQHGKNLSKEEDPEKGLSTEGRKDVKQTAGWLKSFEVSVNEIWHSGLKRARETAEIFAAYLGVPEGMGSYREQSGALERGPDFL